MHTLTEALSLAEQATAQGNRAQAEHIYRQVLQAAPGHPAALTGLAHLAQTAGQPVAAEELLRQALASAPQNAWLHDQLGLALRAQRRVNEAIACHQCAVRMAPEVAALHNNLALALKAHGELSAAEASLRRAVDLDPTFADAHYNRGNTLLALGRLDDAEAAFRRALELNPSDWEPHNNLGNLLKLTGRFAQARAEFDAAIAAEPRAAEAHRNRALLNLLHDDPAGWDEYEQWRWKLPDAAKVSYSMPAWRGEPLAGKTLVLLAEQGLGDTIQFVRFAPQLAALGARVILEAPTRLHRLLSGMAGVAQIVAPGGAAPAADYWASLISLPAMLRLPAEALSNQVPYLQADAERSAHWREKLRPVGGFKVGIVWQGNPDYVGDAFRSLALAHFARLAEVPRVRLISLQRGPGRDQLPPLAATLPVVDLGDELDGGHDAFVDTAAVMQTLDLVISSDTSAAHLAGALGVPVWVALQLAPNWRWLLNRSDTPWYPTMRLFRQSQFNQWGDVFAAMAQELRQRTSGTVED